jgi:hypothetical protein
MSFVDIVITDWQTHGPYQFLQAGLPSRIVAQFLLLRSVGVNLSYAAYRLIIATISSTQLRDGLLRGGKVEFL